MIISNQHKYVFVELPRTGSSTVSRELRLHYAGTRILRKHSTYQEFLKVASEEEKKYFVFTCVRNPLDDAVSHYFKIKTDHHKKFKDGEKAKDGDRKRLADKMNAFLFGQISEKNMDFPTFFRKFHVVSYNTWASMSIGRYDYVMRFENLQDDFATVLKLLGLEPIRPLPYLNVTSERKRDFWTYYTPEIIPRARRIFGPYMKQWGYEFPAEWGDRSVPWWNQLEFDIFNIFRRLYWSLLRPKI